MESLALYIRDMDGKNIRAALRDKKTRTEIEGIRQQALSMCRRDGDKELSTVDLNDFIARAAEEYYENEGEREYENEGMKNEVYGKFLQGMLKGKHGYKFFAEGGPTTRWIDNEYANDAEAEKYFEAKRQQLQAAPSVNKMLEIMTEGYGVNTEAWKKDHRRYINQMFHGDLEQSRAYFIKKVNGFEHLYFDRDDNYADGGQPRGGAINDTSDHYRNGEGVVLHITKVYERSQPANDRIEGTIDGKEFLDTRSNIEAFIKANGYFPSVPGGEHVELAEGGNIEEWQQADAQIKASLTDTSVPAAALWQQGQDARSSAEEKLDIAIHTALRACNKAVMPALCAVLATDAGYQRTFTRVKELLLKEDAGSIDAAITQIDASVARNAAIQPIKEQTNQDKMNTSKKISFKQEQYIDGGSLLIGIGIGAGGVLAASGIFGGEEEDEEDDEEEKLEYSTPIIIKQEGVRYKFSHLDADKESIRNNAASWNEKGYKTILQPSDDGKVLALYVESSEDNQHKATQHAEGGSAGGGDYVTVKDKEGVYYVVGIHAGNATLEKVGNLNEVINAPVENLTVVQAGIVADNLSPEGTLDFKVPHMAWGGSTRYAEDPRVMDAKFASTCSKCKLPIKRGESIVYFPHERAAMHYACGESDYRSFLSAAADEDVYHGTGNPYTGYAEGGPIKWEMFLTSDKMKKNPITLCRYLSKEEAEEMLWYSRPLVLQFQNGAICYAVRDHEGNDGGAWFASKEEMEFPVLSVRDNAELTKKWEDKANAALRGKMVKKISAARIEFTDGTWMKAMADDEGNGPGAIFGQTGHGKHQFQFKRGGLSEAEQLSAARLRAKGVSRREIIERIPKVETEFLQDLDELIRERFNLVTKKIDDTQMIWDYKAGLRTKKEIISVGADHVILLGKTHGTITMLRNDNDTPQTIFDKIWKHKKEIVEYTGEGVLKHQ